MIFIFEYINGIKVKKKNWFDCFMYMWRGLNGDICCIVSLKVFFIFCIKKIVWMILKYVDLIDLKNVILYVYFVLWI